MADLLDTIQAQIAERLTELRPFLDEVTRLEQALAALEEPGARADATPAKAASPRRRSRRAETEKRSAAERDELRERTATLIGERPGVSKAELRAQLGLSGPEVGQLLRRMIDAGAVEEQTLPSGTIGYQAVSSPPEPEPGPELEPGPAPEPAAEPAPEREPGAAPEPDAAPQDEPAGDADPEIA